ncbi:transposase domain-containing protein [Citreicella sp. C3M06]
MNGREPQAWLAEIPEHIRDHKMNRLDELMAWNWTLPD